MNCLSFIFVFSFLAHSFGDIESKQRQIAANESRPSLDNTLIVNVTLDTLPSEILDRGLVKVSLVNAGTSPAKVVGRLSIGYQDSDNREIYAVIRDRSTGDIVGKRGQLYQRERLPPDQVKVLEPGESINTEFHLREWYEIPEGDLEIQIVYDPSEAAKRFPEIPAQTFASDFVPFRIKRSR